MKKIQIIALFLSLIFCRTLSAQSDLKQSFSDAYVLYPELPIGILEAMAYSSSRISNLNPDHDYEPHHGPARYGIFGLIQDGKQFFKSNLRDVCKHSGISIEDFKANPALQVNSVAAWLSHLYSLSGKNSKKVEHWASILKDFSEIPSNTLINQFAQELYSFEVYNNLNLGFITESLSLQRQNIDFNSIYTPSTFKLLTSKNITIDRSGISNGNTTYAPLSTTSADYPPALWVAASSSNYSSRSGTAISAVTIHTVQGSYSGCISWFQNPAANVSAHYVVRSSDGQVTQMVLEVNKAWHVKSGNPYSIGIEHEGYVDNPAWYTNAMYTSSANLTKDICADNNIDPTTCYNGAASASVVTLDEAFRIKGHQHFPSQTHTDPGINWNWSTFYDLVNPVTCFAPTNVAVSSIQLNSATISWNADSSALSFLIQTRIKGTSTWTDLTSTTPTKSLTGLVLGTKYECRVASVCANGNSSYTPITQFKTLASATTNTNCTGTFMDTGGNTANYANNEHYTLTISPAYAESVSITFNSFGLENNYDYMYIYDGTNTSGTLLGTYTSTVSPGTLIANSGSMTIRFYSDGATVSWGWTADWTCTQMTCQPPSGLTTTNVTANSATSTWQSAPNATNYTYKRRVQGTSTWTTLNTSNTSMDNTGLTAATTYEWEVTSTCPYGNSASSIVGVFTTLSPVFCVSKGQSVADEYIANVQIGSINNTTGGNAAGYSDYTNLNTKIYAGSTTSITLTPAFTGTAYPEYFRVWIDINNDFDFLDAGELVYDAGAPSSAVVNGNIAIPYGTTPGPRRMRVSMKYNVAPEPCEQFQYGEVEDYLVNILEAPLCGVPIQLEAVFITANSATLNWAAGQGATQYNVRFRIKGSSVWNNRVAANTTFPLTDLGPATDYEFEIGSICNATNGAYSTTANFRTDNLTGGYCISYGLHQTDEWIASIKIGSIDNTTGAASGGYADYSQISTDLVAGTSYSVQLTPGYSGWAYAEYFRIWIDLDNNLDFNGPGELVFDAGAATAGQVNSTMTIPTSATPGNKKMRVTMKYNGSPTPCEYFQYGEVEDYTVNILEGAPQVPPSFYTLGNGTVTSNTVVYDTYYMDHRFQMILTKAELQAAGWDNTQNYIGNIAFSTAGASQHIMNGLTIKMKNVTESSFASTSFITGATTVYNSNYTASANSWNAHNFSNAFLYNGTGNILIELCFDNSTYDVSTTMYGTTEASYKSLRLRSDVSTGGVCSNTTGTRTFFRPNTKLKFMSTATGRIGEEGAVLPTLSNIESNVFSIYPNPVSESFKIDYSASNIKNGSPKVHLSLYEISGKQVEVFGGEFELSLLELRSFSLRDLDIKSGIYLLKLQHGDQIKSTRIMYLDK